MVVIHLYYSYIANFHYEFIFTAGFKFLYMQVSFHKEAVLYMYNMMLKWKLR